MKACYYPGCTDKVTSKEHIPPKSLFPENQRQQLLTVPACDKHNSGKSKNDLYALAHICIACSPNNQSRNVFLRAIAPQLDYNHGLLRKTIAADAVKLPNGAVAYKVDKPRLNDFFTALSYGLIYKASNSSLPQEYKIDHIYHHGFFENSDEVEKAVKDSILEFYSGEPLELMKFGNTKYENKPTYIAKIFGIKDFKSSITIVHEFFGTLKVTSMLTK